MLKLLICGSHLHLEDQEDEQQPMNSSAGSSPCSTPRRSRKPGFYKRHNNNKDKNPYANRGLDKFSALLAYVEEKRQKIYAETGSEDISLVRFVYKNSDDLVPIVVKLKDSNNNNKKDRKTKRSSSAINYEEAKENIKQATNNSDISLDKFPIESSVAESTEVKKEPKPKPESYYKKMTKIRSFSCTLDLWKRPPYYLPVVVIMILLLLTVFGRSVAILCTSISWYVVPTLTESSGRTKLSTKKKDYVKKLSDRRIVTEGQVTSPRISHPGGSKDRPSAKHGHQKSW